MADLQQMSRILYRHDWVSVEDWARNIEQLADLTDEEIVQLESCGAHEGAGEAAALISLSQSHGTGSPAHTSLVMRTLHRVATFCGGFRFSVRRAY
jgi:hypothetical protein